MKYVPVLRYRREERAALRSVKLTEKTMPLIEIMKERAGLVRSGDFAETHLEDFKAYNYPFMVDFPIYFHVTNSTTKNIRDFLRGLKLKPSDRLTFFEHLITNKFMIPVISYDTESSYIPGTYQNDCIRLRTNFKRLGFRIFETNDFDVVITDIKKVLTNQDILIYDIDDIPHTQDIIKKRYDIINELKSKFGCKSVVIRAAISSNIVLNRLIDDSPISKADNSLLKEYAKYGFDAFGDFAGIRKDTTITDGGPEDPSPGFLFYSWMYNSYIGYKGRFSDWQEFTNHIKPTVMKSTYWNDYSTQHHSQCPGCLSISNIPTNGAGNWKRYTIQHYLTTMEEFLI